MLCSLIAIVVSLFAGSPAAAASALRTSNAHKAQPHSQRGRPLKKQESDWFRLSHLGNQSTGVQARERALQQAAALEPKAGVSLPNSSNWAPLGPSPIQEPQSCFGCNGYVADNGRVTALAVNPQDSSDVWLGAADGGLWHSHDGGQTWSSITDLTFVNTPSGVMSWPTQAIGSIAVDPTNPQTIYVGTGEANFTLDDYWGMGVFKSTDGGVTWTQYGFDANYNSIFYGLSIGRIVVDPASRVLHPFGDYALRDSLVHHGKHRRSPYHARTKDPTDVARSCP